MPRAYCPSRGDVVWINLSPQSGHEQSGRRPACIISPSEYNRKVGLAILCPVTSQIKGYPFEVLIPKGLPISGAVLSDQVKSLDWKARHTGFICHLPEETMKTIIRKLETLITI